MGAIIRMDSKKFMKDFIPEIEKHEDYQFIVISENITTKNKFKNVKAIPRLMPPPQVVGTYVDEGMKEYKQVYLQYLKNPQIEAFISIIVKAAVVNDMNLVLLCSKSEDEYKYLDLICEYIEQVYGLNTFTWKDFQKNPEKASKIKHKDDVMKTLTKKFNKMEKSNVDLDTKPDKEDVIKELKKFDKKELKKYAKSKKIKLGDDMDKKDMIKKIAKKMAQ